MKRLIVITIVCLAGFLLYHYVSGKSGSGGDTEQSGVATVSTAAIEKKTLTDSLESYGTVTAANKGIVNISIPRAAVITRLAVMPGQAVKKGDALLELSPDPEGNVAYTQALTAYNLAKSERGRIKQLLDEQLATDSQLATADKALHDAEAALEAQKKLGNGMAVQKITAPFDGVISSVSAAQGDKTNPGTAVMQIAAAKDMRAELGIEPKSADNVKPGMKVTVWPVFDKDTGVEGEITQVQGMIDPKSQMVTAFAAFTGGAALLPGSAVRARIVLSEKESDAVPVDAVLRDDKGAYIFQVENEKAHRVDVTTGLESDGFTGIEGKFDPKLPVVTTGNYELEDGMAVREEAAQ
ncbi:MAG: efflux RND transporter periplasmic adaptor subunit [Pseudomonadota bacterium]|nr:efflux RND transporter periplasmic adaptor subunit [Pseudomonadota bacterium]MDE3037160.1 efflux RND transporter periplasmic adaptor subunit [Pseudomonadota bacterium]